MGQALTGQSIAITGRLAAMSRQAAVGLIERNGGSFHSNLSRQTTILVVGREGWPLQANGHVTTKLRRARQLRQQGFSLAVVPEEDFLRRLELPHLASEVCQSYTVGELTRLLGVPRRRIEAWQRCGLLPPTGAALEIPCFDFRQVAAARTLVKLLDSGVAPPVLRRSLRQLQACFPDSDSSGMLSRLARDGGRIVFRSDDGHLMEATGQLLLEFDAPAESSTVAWSAAAAGDDLFDEALQHEEAGRLHEAADRYRQLLLAQGPDADICFNLANVLARLDEPQAAIERLHEAVSLDRDHVDAWNNLGNLLADLGCLNDSRAAYGHAVALEPDYADARYGLADVLEQLGLLAEARAHWRGYLELEPVGAWADYARQRLASQTG